MNTIPQIIQTSAGQFYRVRDTGNPDLAHVWYGVAVKRAGRSFVDKKNAREELVRKEATRVVDTRADALLADLDAELLALLAS